MVWKTILKAILSVSVKYIFKLLTILFSGGFKNLYLSVTKRGGDVMFLNAFKQICDLVAGVIAIFKDGALKDLSRWLGLVTPVLVNAKGIYDGCLEFPVAIQDQAIVSECAKYFDSKFVFPGKFEDVDEDLAEVLMKSVKIALAVFKPTA